MGGEIDQAAPVDETATSVALRAARILVLGVVLLDSTDILLDLGPGPVELPLVVGDLVQSVTGVAAVAAVLWSRFRTGTFAVSVLVLLCLLRGRLVGIELDVLLIAVAVGVMLTRRRGALLVLAGAVAGPALLWHVGAQDDVGVAAVVLVLLGAVAGAMLRLVVTAQRRSRTLARHEHEARELVRAQLASDLREVVGNHLRETEEALASLSSRASLVQMRRVLDVTAADSRAALASLRNLLAVLDDGGDEPDGRGSPPGSVRVAMPDDAPLMQRLPLVLRARHVRLALSLAVALAALRGGLADGVGTALAAVMVAGGAALVTWRRAGASVLLAGGVVVAALVAATSGASASSTLLGLGALSVVALRYRRPGSGVAVLVLTLLSVGAQLLGTGTSLAVLVATVVVAATGSLLGLALGEYYRAVDDADARRTRLGESPATAHRAERRWVAHEMHDIVGHELSRIALHTLAVDGVDDPARLDAAIRDIAETVATTRGALGTLLVALGEPTPAADPVGPHVLLVEAVDEMAVALRSAGHPVALDRDLEAGGVDEAVQRTMVRILQEATTNILRHAPAGAACEVRLFLDDDRVRLHCTNPTGTAKLAQSLGRGLHGIAERAAWLGGSARSGVTGSDGAWVVDVDLPTRAVVAQPARRRSSWAGRVTARAG